MFRLVLLAFFVAQLQGLPTTHRPNAIVPTATAGPALGGLMADAKRPHASAGDDTTPYEVLGACRAGCVEQTLQWPPSDTSCSNNYDCLTCWKLCEKLYEDELKWRALCSENECTIGCTTACKFSFSTVTTPEVTPWEFPEPPHTLEVNENVLHVSWEVPTERPRSNKETPAPSGRPYIVYTLLFRDDNTRHWSRVITTLDLITQVDGNHGTLPGLQFLLLASTPAGLVARGVPPYPAVPDVVVAPTAAPTLPPSTTTTTEAPVPNPIQSEPIVTVYMNNERKLEAEVAWLQSNFQGIKYVITWRLISCNVDPTMPHCPLPTDQLQAHIKAKQQPEMRVVLTDLTYNSRYDLLLTIMGAEHVILSRSVFYTSTCSTVDSTFKLCRPAPRVAPVDHHTAAPPTAATSTTVTERPTTTTTASNPAAANLPSAVPKVIPNNHVENLFDEVQEGFAKYAAAQENDKGSSAQVLLLAAVIALVSAILSSLGGICIYKRFCRKPDELDFTKALQSYTQLPLMTQGSQHSLHHLQLHNAAQHALFNSSALQSFATPKRSQGQTPPTVTFTPPTSYMLPNGAATNAVAAAGHAASGHRWPSMVSIVDGMMPVNSSTPAGSHINLAVPSQIQQAPLQTMVTIDAPDTPHAAFRTHLAAGHTAAPSPRRSPMADASERARSVGGGLNDDASLLTVCHQAASRFSASAGDLTNTPSNCNRQPARRQIHFDRKQEAVVLDTKAEVVVGRHAAEVTTIADTFSPYQRVLHTVPEDVELELDEVASHADDVQDKMLDWEYEDFELPAFRARIETM